MLQMKEGGWGIRLHPDPVPNSLFSLLEGAFIQEMAASGGVPAADIPCSWSRDSPSCAYRPQSISVAPVPTQMGQPAITPPRPAPSPTYSALHAPHPFAGGSMRPSPLGAPTLSQQSDSSSSRPSAGPSLGQQSWGSDSRASGAPSLSQRSYGSDSSSSSPFAQPSSQDWPVPRGGTRLDPPTASMQGLGLQPQGYPLHGSGGPASDLQAQGYPLQGNGAVAGHPLGVEHHVAPATGTVQHPSPYTVQPQPAGNLGYGERMQPVQPVATGPLAVGMPPQPPGSMAPALV